MKKIAISVFLLFLSVPIFAKTEVGFFAFNSNEQSYAYSSAYDFSNRWGKQIVWERSESNGIENRHKLNITTQYFPVWFDPGYFYLEADVNLKNMRSKEVATAGCYENIFKNKVCSLQTEVFTGVYCKENIYADCGVASKFTWNTIFFGLGLEFSSKERLDCPIGAMIDFSTKNSLTSNIGVVYVSFENEWQLIDFETSNRIYFKYIF